MITLTYNNVTIMIWPDLDRVLVVRPPCVAVWLSIEEAMEAVERARTYAD